MIYASFINTFFILLGILVLAFSQDDLKKRLKDIQSQLRKETGR